MVIKELIGIWKKDDLLDRASHKTRVMLQNSEKMFDKAVAVLLDGKNGGFNVKKEDDTINKFEIEVRQKILSHLVVSSKADIVASLILIGVVKDIERIGDLSRDIVNLTSTYRKKVSKDKYIEGFKKLKETTMGMFKLTYEAFEKSDMKKGKKVMSDYDKIARKCDKIVKELASATKCNSQDAVSYVLLSRYIKRVNGHLMNIASTVVRPFHKISFRNL